MLICCVMPCCADRRVLIPRTNNSTLGLILHVPVDLTHYACSFAGGNKAELLLLYMMVVVRCPAWGSTLNLRKPQGTSCHFLIPCAFVAVICYRGLQDLRVLAFIGFKLAMRKKPMDGSDLGAEQFFPSNRECEVTFGVTRHPGIRWRRGG